MCVGLTILSRRVLALATALALALSLSVPAAADDDDDSDSNDSPGAASEAHGGDGVRAGSLNLGPNPGSDFGADVRNLMGLLFGRPAPQPPAAAPVVARPPPRPLPRPPPPVPVGAAQEDSELVARNLGPAGRTQALAEGFVVVAERGSFTRLRAPQGLGMAGAAQRLRVIAPAATVDLNHLYRPGSARPGCRGAACQASTFFTQIGWPEKSACDTGLALGLIDTRIDPSVAGLGARVDTVTLRGPGRAPSGTAHGTAIASLLVGSGSSEARGLLPQARLLAVDAFHRRPEGDAADAFDIAAAIEMLAGAGPRVVAMPFAGPANAVVDEVGAMAAARNISLVAAAGNDGPKAAPQYPAAHPWAIAVTAVDSAERVYAQAVQGPHIDFAAPGVGLLVPIAAARPLVPRSGTSFAVPFVAAALALLRQSGLDAEGAADDLARAAHDLGPPGRDPTFGWGLVRAAGVC